MSDACFLCDACVTSIFYTFPHKLIRNNALVVRQSYNHPTVHLTNIYSYITGIHHPLWYIQLCYGASLYHAHAGTSMTDTTINMWYHNNRYGGGFGFFYSSLVQMLAWYHPVIGRGIGLGLLVSYNIIDYVLKSLCFLLGDKGLGEAGYGMMMGMCITCQWCWIFLFHIINISVHRILLIYILLSTHINFFGHT